MKTIFSLYAEAIRDTIEIDEELQQAYSDWNVKRIETLEKLKNEARIRSEAFHEAGKTLGLLFYVIMDDDGNITAVSENIKNGHCSATIKI